MVAQAVGIPLGLYLTTRSRHQFELDAKATMSKIMMPIECVLSVVNSALGGESSSSSSQIDMDAVRATPRHPDAPDFPEPNDELARRERRSSTQYGWYRRVSGRSYNVHNLDTRNPGEFKRATDRIGQAMGGKRV